MSDTPAAQATPPTGVLVVGSLNVDLVVHAVRLPRPGETLTGNAFTTDQGGKGANQAVAAARMGARVAMIGRVGDDEHGRRLRAALQRDGIAADAVGTDTQRPTGVASIMVGADGENCIVVVPGANHALEPAHIDPQAALMAQARVVVTQLETPLHTVLHALHIARQAGAVTVLNAAPAVALSAAQLQDVEWLVVNEGEAGLLLGVAVHDVEQAGAAAQALRARGPAHVVVTLGADGLVHAGAEHTTHHPAVAAQAVDTTGAGDAFVGALAAGLAQALAPTEALRRAQAAAAIAVTRRGAQSAMPTLAEVIARTAA